MHKAWTAGRILDCLAAFILVIVAVLYIRNFIDNNYQHGNNPGLAWLWYVVAFLVVAVIHGVYGLTSVKRTKFSITTLILVFGWPVLILLGYRILFAVFPSFNNFGTALLIGWGLVIVEALIIVVHLGAFVYDCIKSR